MEASGYQFTWSRDQKILSRVEERLDMALCTSSWLDKFPEIAFWNIDLSSSDHLPILLKFFKRDTIKIKPNFRFNKIWLLKGICHEVVDAWMRSYSNVRDKLSLTLQIVVYDLLIGLVTCDELYFESRRDRVLFSTILNFLLEDS
ncbi:uncharacterized protein LOC126687619 [Mercurialis annua]|uniref:uncharacterized protein LOC126687619 n=1 Tax=Mercurialis annua TaxID=3986 RepID=UPI00215F5AA9|nr:uncharacterized protein LOC126687619 [Mercurialis annua]